MIEEEYYEEMYDDPSWDGLELLFGDCEPEEDCEFYSDIEEENEWGDHYEE